MARTVAIGVQDFEQIIKNNYFYIDKTSFIKEWWDSGDSVTLIARPRRFGKTLNMSMLDYFFSINHADGGELFEGLSVWEDGKYRELQGKYPVISLSFSNVKGPDYLSTRMWLNQMFADLYTRNNFLIEEGLIRGADKQFFESVTLDMPEYVAVMALNKLSEYLYHYYGKKVIILLDEYDTPMQEAYVNGYWEELVSFIRNLLNSTFKTNPYLERAVMTGITRVSKESVFSDLNHLEVITTTSGKYATAFGFTEEEVFDALDECGYGDKKEDVKQWYDGFIFGDHRDIYNPWSILNFLDTGRIAAYWANTSSNRLAGKLIQEGSKKVKTSFEDLLWGKSIRCPIDEQIVYNQLDRSESAIWSLLLASGYLKVIGREREELVSGGYPNYELELTNLEVKRMFERMVHDWFDEPGGSYHEFIQALLQGDIDAMNEYMNRVSQQMFSSFDTGKGPSGAQPERFYHGFVLGLAVDLCREYEVSSNRESGFGRYDVMLEPKEKNKDAYILEFKVFNSRREETLEDTVRAALAQIGEKQYEAALVARGVPAGRIRKYGFAFKGKKVLIG